jgi:polar amino acid transport system permease protein
MGVSTHVGQKDFLDGLPLTTSRRVRAPLHAGWWALVVLLGAAVAWVIAMVATNPKMQWEIVGEYIFSPEVLAGLLRTLQLTAIAMGAGIAGGILLAVMQLSPVGALVWISRTYVWLLRGTPLLVQIIFWYNIAAIFPTVSFLGFGDLNTNDLISPFTAAILALALNEAAYMAEVVRGGLLAVDHGQTEAARSLGLTHGLTLRRIVIPQAARVIAPPTGNQVISMLKASALVSVTSTPELLYSVQIIYNNNFQTIPLLIVASIWYLIVTSVLYVIQYYVERRFSRGDQQALPPTPFQRLPAFLRRRQAASAMGSDHV